MEGVLVIPSISHYAYFDDGNLKQFKDLNDQIGDPHYVQFHYMSRAYSYDQAGRVSGVGQVPNYNVPPPFTGSYGYDVFDNLTTRSGQYALNSSQSDSASYTNNRRNGWSYNAEGQITNSSDNSDSGGSSTRTWTYDAQDALAVSSEVRNGQTTTLALGYDGDGELMNELFNGSTSDYFVRSSVLGTALTKLTSTGGKDITYVPTNGLVAPMQYQNPGYTPTVGFVHRDARGIQEDGSRAYDPLGNPIYNVQPPLTGPPPYVPFYGATYGGLSWNSFANANNLAAGCNVRGFPMDCSRAMIGAMGLDFAMNLPGSHLDNLSAEASYASNFALITSVWVKDPSAKTKPSMKFPSNWTASQGHDDGGDERGPGHWLTINWGSNFELGPTDPEPEKPDKTIAAAIDSVRTILKEQNPCSDYFGPNGIKALDAFEKILRRGYPSDLNDTRLGIKQSGAQTTYNSPTEFRTFENAVINNAGPFFNLLSKTRFGGYNPASHQSQAIQILHELAHLVYKDGAPLIPDDGKKAQENISEKNTNEVLKHCKAEVDKVKK